MPDEVLVNGAGDPVPMMFDPSLGSFLRYGRTIAGWQINPLRKGYISSRPSLASGTKFLTIDLSSSSWKSLAPRITES